jgi:hypothetical protein
MITGVIPEADEAREAFPELPLEEMGEGYAEFYLVVGRYEDGEWDYAKQIPVDDQGETVRAGVYLQA